MSPRFREHHVQAGNIEKELTSVFMADLRGQASICRHRSVHACMDALKKALIHDKRYATREAAKQDIFEWIDVFYIQQRCHFTLGYRSPAEFEAMRKVA